MTGSQHCWKSNQQSAINMSFNKMPEKVNEMITFCFKWFPLINMGKVYELEAILEDKTVLYYYVSVV